LYADYSAGAKLLIILLNFPPFRIDIYLPLNLLSELSGNTLAPIALFKEYLQEQVIRLKTEGQKQKRIAVAVLTKLKKPSAFNLLFIHFFIKFHPLHADN
jgi:hypothetical protein